jgi:hypothetical protein
MSLLLMSFREYSKPIFLPQVKVKEMFRVSMVEIYWVRGKYVRTMLVLPVPLWYYILEKPF